MAKERLKHLNGSLTNRPNLLLSSLLSMSFLARGYGASDSGWLIFVWDARNCSRPCNLVCVKGNTCWWTLLGMVPTLGGVA